jgi:inosine-uridine nucleoside N-ribohydrolase
MDGFGGTLIEYIERNGPVVPKNVAKEGAVDFLTRITEEYPGEITIVCLAPLTNLGKAI